MTDGTPEQLPQNPLQEREFNQGQLARNLQATLAGPIASLGSINAILSIGFGAGEEFKPLRELFPLATLHGIDSEKDIVENTQFFLQDEMSDSSNTAIWRAHAQNANAYRRHDYDLVMFRSLETHLISYGTINAILDETEKHLNKQGQLYFTVEDQDHEVSPLKTFLENRGYQVKIYENQFPFKRDGISTRIYKENYHLVAQKLTT